MYVLIKKNQYTILKNTYIRFEKYGALTRMNDDGRTLVDAHLWTNKTELMKPIRWNRMDGIRQIDVDGCKMEASERRTKL
jgi:hypothetical protein